MALTVIISAYYLSVYIAEFVVETDSKNVSEQQEQTAEGYEISSVIGDTEIEVEEGDEGIQSMPVWNITTALDIPKERATRQNLINLAISYNEKIPYQEGEYYWLEGYPVFNEGIDSRFVPEGTSVGLGSWGYCVWIYRNIFNVTDKSFLNPEEMYESLAVEKEELKIGDIGMYKKEGKNHYGIFIGYDNDRPVFTHCDSIPKEKYPGGCNKLSYLEEGGTPYFMGNRPVKFQYFFRPNVAWEEK